MFFSTIKKKYNERKRDSNSNSNEKYQKILNKFIIITAFTGLLAGVYKIIEHYYLSEISRKWNVIRYLEKEKKAE
jgi:hypothetical protein